MGHSLRTTCTLCVVLTVALFSPRARAEPDAQAARDHFERGAHLYEENNFAGAAEEFRAAYEAKPASAFIFNEAVCYERLNDRTKAAALFQRYLAAAPAAHDRADIERRIDQLTRGEPTAAPADGELHGVVLIESQPPGATIYLDSKSSPPLGVTPWSGTLAGTHTFILVNPNFRDVEKSVTAKPGTYTQLFVALSQDQYLGWLEVRANVPAADVYIDGKGAGAIARTPFMGNLTPGKHTITVGHAGYDDVSRDIVIRAGEAEHFDATLERASIGFIHVSGSSLETATVKLDGKVACDHTPCRFQTTAGEHRITVSRDGQKTYSRKLTVGKATDNELTVKLAPEQPRTKVVWRFVAAAVLIGGGTYMTIKANDLGNMGMLSDDDKTKQKIFRYGGVGLLVAGGITAVTGIVGLVVERGPRSVGIVESRDLGVSLAPDVGPGYAGLIAIGHF